MKRKIYKQLLDWKNNRPGEVALLIEGARRIGVTSDIYRKLLFGKLEVNEGMLVENIVAQMLVAVGHSLYFFGRSSAKKRGAYGNRLPSAEKQGDEPPQHHSRRSEKREKLYAIVAQQVSSPVSNKYVV